MTSKDDDDCVDVKIEDLPEAVQSLIADLRKVPGAKLESVKVLTLGKKAEAKEFLGRTGRPNCPCFEGTGADERDEAIDLFAKRVADEYVSLFHDYDHKTGGYTFCPEAINYAAGAVLAAIIIGITEAIARKIDQPTMFEHPEQRRILASGVKQIAAEADARVEAVHQAAKAVAANG